MRDPEYCVDDSQLMGDPVSSIAKQVAQRFHHVKWYHISVKYKHHGLISGSRSWSFDALTAYPFGAQDRQRTGYQRKQRN